MGRPGGDWGTNREPPYLVTGAGWGQVLLAGLGRSVRKT